MCLRCKPLTANELALALALARSLSSFNSPFAAFCPRVQLAVDYHALGLNLCTNGIVPGCEWGNWELVEGMSGEGDIFVGYRTETERRNLETRKTTLLGDLRQICIFLQAFMWRIKYRRKRYIYI